MPAESTATATSCPAAVHRHWLSAREPVLAIEPTTTPWNSLAAAVAAGLAHWIEPSAAARWQVGARTGRD